jgi:hypothetical protein
MCWGEYPGWFAETFVVNVPALRFCCCMAKTKNTTDYNRKWRAENAEYDRARKRQWYLDNRSKLVEQAKARLAKVRQQEGPRYPVGTTRSYLIADGRVYFNSKLGFSEEEILEIALKMRLAAKDAAKRIISDASAGDIPARRRAKQKAGSPPA